MKFSKYIYKAVTPVMALFQKQHGLPFKQDYDNLRSTREESAASAGTAQSERQLHRNQSAVCASHNVPSDILGHSDVSTTEIYARADETMKRKALLEAYKSPTEDKLPEWKTDKNLLDWLKSL